jgi:LysR family transcriptional regulator, nitrogen assimilation regulatory protein
MTLRQLHYFLRILELKSFSKAAANLHIAQPALGLQIRKLEEELGVPLLNRHSRGVTPTEAGLILREHAQTVLRQIERAKLALLDFAGPPRGKVAVGVTPTVNMMLAASLVSRCRQEFPKVGLSLVEGMSETLMEWVENDRLDMAFSYNANPARGLVCEPLLAEDLLLIAAPSDERKLRKTVLFSDVAKLPLILPTTRHGLRLIVDDAADKRGLELNLVMEIDSVHASKELVERGLGYTILPMGAVSQEVQAGRLVVHAIAQPQLARKMYLVYSAKRPSSKGALGLRQIMRDVVGAGLAAGNWAWRSVA